MIYKHECQESIESFIKKDLIVFNEVCGEAGTGSEGNVAGRSAIVQVPVRNGTCLQWKRILSECSYVVGRFHRICTRHCRGFENGVRMKMCGKCLNLWLRGGRRKYIWTAHYLSI